MQAAVVVLLLLQITWQVAQVAQAAVGEVRATQE
jgi:hypothetical protein